MECIYDDGFIINHSIDLNTISTPKIQVPQLAYSNCNRLVISMLTNRDIELDINKGINMNGITDNGPPFFSPLVWCALINVCDWKKEKFLIEKMLKEPIDCNYIGMCGFNLFHMYIVQALCFEFGFKKLEWWIQHPMVNINIYCLYINHRPCISVMHPCQLINNVAKLYQLPKNRINKVIGFLLSRGMSKESSLFFTIRNPLKLIKKKKKTKVDKFFLERLRKQWGVSTDEELGNAILKKKPIRKKTFDYELTPTPQMNNLEDTPTCQHFIFVSPTSGIRFGFHSSYLDMIKKTHIFPFTSEPLPHNEIRKWLQISHEQWIPREEFISNEIIDEWPSFLYKEQRLYKEDFSLAMHMLSNWITSIYPYSRFMLILTMPYDPEKTFSYLCKEMKNGACYFHPFHRPCSEDWTKYFFWACYESIIDGFPFPNQLEEIISRLEIYKVIPSEFNETYPSLRSFLFVYGDSSNLFKIYAEEYDYSLMQVYYIFRRLSTHFTN